MQEIAQIVRQKSQPKGNDYLDAAAIKLAAGNWQAEYRFTDVRCLTGTVSHECMDTAILFDESVVQIIKGNATKQKKPS